MNESSLFDIVKIAREQIPTFPVVGESEIELGLRKVTKEIWEEICSMKLPGHKWPSEKQ